MQVSRICHSEWAGEGGLEKIKTVAEWPRPENRKQLQRFLGFAHFYRFHPGVQQSGSPLTELTYTKVPFWWTPEADAAFSELRNRFMTAPILPNLSMSHNILDQTISYILALSFSTA